MAPLANDSPGRNGGRMLVDDDPFMDRLAAPGHFRFANFDTHLFALGPGSSPEQAKRALDAHLKEIDRRIQDVGRLGTTLMQQRNEIADQCAEMDKLRADAELRPELRQKLMDIEKEFNDVERDTARALLPRRVPSGSGGPPPPPPDHHEGRVANRRSASPSKLESTATGSPTKFGVPNNNNNNRRVRNSVMSRNHDIEFATEISTSLIAQVRSLQALLAERDEEIRVTKQERSRLEVESEGFQERVRTLDESETRYKDENWDLETRIHSLLATQREAEDREKKLGQTAKVLAAEKTAIQRELDESKGAHARLAEEHEADRKQHDMDLNTTKRNLEKAENEAAALRKQNDELKNQNQELVRAIALQQRQARDHDQNAPLSDNDDFETATDGPTADEGASPPPPLSPVKGQTPRHAMLETETLRASFLHAQRQLQNQRSLLHREKTEKLELRRMLQETRDEVEKLRTEAGPGVVGGGGGNLGGKRGRRAQESANQAAAKQAAAAAAAKQTRLLAAASRVVKTEIFDDDYDEDKYMEPDWEEIDDSPSRQQRTKKADSKKNKKNIFGGLTPLSSTSNLFSHPNAPLLNHPDLLPHSSTNNGNNNNNKFDTADDQFETANETSDAAFETAHERGAETDDFQTGVEDFDETDDAPTETDTPTRTTATKNLFGRIRAAPSLGVNRSTSFKSTASTSNDEEYTSIDEDERRFGEVHTPPSSSRTRLRMRSSRGHFRRRTEDVQSSPASFTHSSSSVAATTPEQRNGQSLFAELGDFGSDDDDDDDDDDDNASIGPESLRSMRRSMGAATPVNEATRAMTPGSMRSTMGSVLGGRRSTMGSTMGSGSVLGSAVSVARSGLAQAPIMSRPRILMVDCGVMTDPIHFEDYPPYFLLHPGRDVSDGSGSSSGRYSPAPPSVINVGVGPGIAMGTLAEETDQHHQHQDQESASGSSQVAVNGGGAQQHLSVNGAQHHHHQQQQQQQQQQQSTDTATTQLSAADATTTDLNTWRPRHMSMTSVIGPDNRAGSSIRDSFIAMTGDSRLSAYSDAGVQYDAADFEEKLARFPAPPVFIEEDGDDDDNANDTKDEDITKDIKDISSDKKDTEYSDKKDDAEIELVVPPVPAPLLLPELAFSPVEALDVEPVQEQEQDAPPLPELRMGEVQSEHVEPVAEPAPEPVVVVALPSPPNLKLELSGVSWQALSPIASSPVLEEPPVVTPLPDLELSAIDAQSVIPVVTPLPGLELSAIDAQSITPVDEPAPEPAVVIVEVPVPVAAPSSESIIPLLPDLSLSAVDSLSIAPVVEEEEEEPAPEPAVVTVKAPVPTPLVIPAPELGVSQVVVAAHLTPVESVEEKNIPELARSVIATEAVEPVTMVEEEKNIPELARSVIATEAVEPVTMVEEKNIPELARSVIATEAVEPVVEEEEGGEDGVVELAFSGVVVVVEAVEPVPEPVVLVESSTERGAAGVVVLGEKKNTDEGEAVDEVTNTASASTVASLFAAPALALASSISRKLRPESEISQSGDALSTDGGAPIQNSTEDDTTEGGGGGAAPIEEDTTTTPTEDVPPAATFESLARDSPDSSHDAIAHPTLAFPLDSLDSLDNNSENSLDDNDNKASKNAPPALAFSSITSIETHPVPAPSPPRSPKRDGFILPPNGNLQALLAAASALEDNNTSKDAIITPQEDVDDGNVDDDKENAAPVFSGNNRKPFSTTPIVIAEDDAVEYDESTTPPLPGTPPLHRPLRELSFNNLVSRAAGAVLASKSSVATLSRAHVKEPERVVVMTDQAVQTEEDAEKESILGAMTHEPEEIAPENNTLLLPPPPHARGPSTDSAGTVHRRKSYDALPPPRADSLPLRRPSSSASHRPSPSEDLPPLPPNHRQVIEAARSGSAAGSHPASPALGGSTSHHHPSPALMGPPAWPASAMRRPRTPSMSRPMSPTSARGLSTPRATPHNELQSPRLGLPGALSRQSSVSSFASEIDSRFNMQPLPPIPGGGPGFGPNTDPRMIQAITQTMIGEYLWKYTRKAGRGEMSENRHRRYFWVHPYTRTLYWSDRDPTTAGRAELRAKSVAIEGVRVVTDDNPMPPGLHRKSLVIISPGRTIKFTCTTGQRHETWFNALSYLLLRTNAEGAVDTEEMAGGIITTHEEEEFNPSASVGSRASYGRPAPSTYSQYAAIGGGRPRGPSSLSSYHSRARDSPVDMSIPTLAPSPSRMRHDHHHHRGREREREPYVQHHLSADHLGLQARSTLGSRISGYWKSGQAAVSSLRGRSAVPTTGRNGAASAAGTYDGDVNDSADEESLHHHDSGHLENVRACCDGKHDVGTLSHMSGRGRRSRTHSHSVSGPSRSTTPMGTLRSRV